MFLNRSQPIFSFKEESQHQFLSIPQENICSRDAKWSPVSVDMEHHVEEVAPPPDTTSPTPVLDFAASLATQPGLDPSRPLWMAYVLNVEEGEAASSIVFR